MLANHGFAGRFHAPVLFVATGCRLGSSGAEWGSAGESEGYYWCGEVAAAGADSAGNRVADSGCGPGGASVIFLGGAGIGVGPFV